jgi:hypothetical protein
MLSEQEKNERASWRRWHCSWAFDFYETDLDM